MGVSLACRPTHPLVAKPKTEGKPRRSCPILRAMQPVPNVSQSGKRRRVKWAASAGKASERTPQPHLVSLIIIWPTSNQPPAAAAVAKPSRTASAGSRTAAHRVPERLPTQGPGRVKRVDSTRACGRLQASDDGLLRGFPRGGPMWWMGAYMRNMHVPLCLLQHCGFRLAGRLCGLPAHQPL